MKTQISIVFLLFAFVGSLLAQKGQYVVQLAAFNTHVKTDYFVGIDGVYEVEDHHKIHRYYVGGFDGQSDAESAAKDARNKGFANARVIDMKALHESCAKSCDSPRVTSIFFDFDKYYLRASARAKLDRLVDVLGYYPDYSVELRAHTDAKGSNEYNDELSINRANAARDYVVSKGVDASRIKTKTFGETNPIAKNELADGKDTEEGRQLNRRVEVWLIDEKGGEVEGVVDQIYVPAHLQTK